MKNDLTLNVGTHYNGDGLKKLDGALKNSAKTVNETTKVIGSISNELGQMSGAAGKAAQAASGLFSALAAGGPIGLAIAGITAAVSALVSAFNSAKESAKVAADYIRKSFEDSMQAVSDKFAEIKTALSKGLARDRAEAGFANERNDITTRQGINAVRNQALRDRSYAQNDYERKRITARENRDVAMLEANAAYKKQMVDAETLRRESERQAEAYNRATIAQIEAERNKEEWGSRTASGRAEYERLKANADAAQNVVREKGANAVVRQWDSTSSNGMGGVVTVTNTVTAQNELESATNALKKFEEENKILIEDIKAFHKAEEDLKKAVEERENLETQSKDALEKYNNAVQKNALVDAERETKIKQLNEKFDEEMKSIDKSIQAEKDAAQKKKEAEEKIRKAEEERQRQLQAEEERQNAIENLQIMRQNILNQDNKTAVQRLEERKAEQEASKKLAEAEKKAAEILEGWKLNPQKNFEDWDRDQRRAQAANDRAARRQANNLQAAQGQANGIANRIFDKNGNIRNGANAFDIGRFARQADFLGFGNVNDAQFAGLQAARDNLQNKFFNADGTLKKGVNQQSRDFQAFKQLDKALKNAEAVRDAEKRRKDAEAREKKRAEDEDKRTKSLADIDKELKEFTKKVGI